MSKEIEKREIQEAIIDAAERLLDRYGYGKMTMSDLAEEAGIGVGTTYLHFGGKADVALAVVARFHQEHLERLEEIARTDESAVERLRQMLIARVLLRFDKARCQRHPM
ncbi:MAG: TetR/AcrR family transcriptional regulator, partial [Armatimonadota bacterium]|nr:TetR/AcrR family transcriptional regulator [Armatimonadota bacterium]